MKKHARTKSKQTLPCQLPCSPSNNNFSEKYCQFTKESKIASTPLAKHKRPSSKLYSEVKDSSPEKEILTVINRAVSPKSNTRVTKMGSSSSKKIKINMEIKNINIYGGAPAGDSMFLNNMHKSSSDLKLSAPGKVGKKLHKKTISSLQQPISTKNNHNPPSSNKQKNLKETPAGTTNVLKVGKETAYKMSSNQAKHKKTKSQENLKLSPNQWGDLLSQYGPPRTSKKTEKEVEELCPISKFASCNRTGFAADKKDKVNQDTMVGIQNFMMKNRSLFGVCDGHGVNGHYVSEFIKEILPENIEFYLIKNNMLHKHNKSLTESSIRDAFAKTSKDLFREMEDAGIDIMFSGTTACFTYLYNSHLYCANLGDSRAIICNRSAKREEWSVQELSRDHKGEDQREADRIKINGGRVFPYYDEDGSEMGPHRVWLGQKNIPGLAMTRSFGDYVASTVGVISEPEILSFQIQKENKFMIVASDGLWEFISNEEAMELVKPAFVRNDVNEAVEVLQAKAVEAWKRQDENIDDITIIVVFFKYY